MTGNNSAGPVLTLGWIKTGLILAGRNRERLVNSLCCPVARRTSESCREGA